MITLARFRPEGLEMTHRIETTRRVVPSSPESRQLEFTMADKRYTQGRSSKSHFGDTDTLSLATGNTTNEIRSDLGVVGVAETEDRHDDFSGVSRELLSR
jgi:hypothetical protein